MKYLHALGIGVLLMLSSATGHSKPVVFGFSENSGAKTTDLFFAEESELNKVIGWQPGRDKDLLALKQLITIARARLHQEQPTLVPDPVFGLSGIIWRRTDPCWIVEVTFYCISKPKPGKLPLRDGDGMVTIRMLPNGIPVTTKTRAMTDEESKGVALPRELQDAKKN